MLFLRLIENQNLLISQKSYNEMVAVYMSKILHKHNMVMIYLT